MKRSPGLIAAVVMFELLTIGKHLVGQGVVLAGAIPVLTITSAQHEKAHGEGFTMPVAALRLKDGTIVVAEAHGGRLSFFDKSGHLTKSVGREGEGPGEFRHIGWVGVCGQGTMLVWDRMNRRFTEVSGDGSLGRQFRVPAPDVPGPVPNTISCSLSGGIVAQPVAKPSRAIDPRTPFFRGQAPILFLSSDGGLQLSATQDLPAGEIALFPGGAVPRPLGRQTSLALGRSHLFVGTADSGAVDIYSLKGKFLSTLSIPIQRRRPTQANIEAAVDQLLEEIRTPMRDSVRARLLRLPLPDELPSYSGLFVDGDDWLWVQTSFPGDPEIRLLALDSRGGRFGEIVLPVTGRVADIGKDFILVLQRDQDDEVHVLLYRIRRFAN